jgi:hypothetical protein
MPEQEDLVLTVRLDDQASAQLERLRRQVNELGSDSGGMARMRRQTVDSTREFRGMNAEVSALATRAGIVGGVIGGVTTELVRMGSQLASRATDFKAYADSMVALQRSAAGAGTSLGNMRSALETFARSGIDAGTATRNITGFSEAYAKLQRLDPDIYPEAFG